MHLNRCGIVLVSCLLGLLSHLTAYAGPAKEQPRQVVRPSADGGLPHDFVASILEVIRAVTERSGCAVDPLGRCLPIAAATSNPFCPGNPQDCLERR